MIPTAPDRPWQPDASRTAVRGRLLLRLRGGEAPDRIPHQRDVAQGHRTAPATVDGGPIDRAIRKHSPGFQVTRVHRSAATLGAPGDGHLRWDDAEEETGVSRVLRVDIDPDASVLRTLDALRALGVVESASPWYLSHTPFQQPSAEAATQQRQDPFWAWRMVGARQALAWEPGDTALIVAIVDSGLSMEHPELRGRHRPGIDTVDLGGAVLTRGLKLVGDHVGPDREPVDEMGHGTACGSIIGARGVHVPPGLGGACRLLPARVLAAAQATERGVTTAIGALPDIDAGLKLAIDLGARVLNLSFGTPETALRPDDPKPHADIVAYARRRGCVLVAASGNSGTEVRYYPSCLDGVIAVGSVGPDGRPSRFTSRGDHVDLSAPGERIPVAGVEGYRYQSGTSFAAPFVAATAALLAARFARAAMPLDPDLVRDLLMSTARPFPGTSVQGCGAGILDAPAALSALDRELANRMRGPPAQAPPQARGVHDEA